MNRIFSISFVLAFAVLQGCAFTDATLDVGMPLDAEMRGPLSSVDSMSLQMGELQDERIDKERIGWKKNGYGANTADILTVEPVEEILRAGMVKTLEENGHAVGASGVRIDSVLKNFWLEFDVNFWTVEFIGNIEAMFVLVGEAGSEIYRNTYSGSYSEKTGGGGEKTWAKIMSKTVASLFEDFAFDEDLVEVLEDYSPGQVEGEALDGALDEVGAELMEAEVSSE